MAAVTLHGQHRMKERCGLSKKSTRRLAEIAFTEGITHKEATGKLCKLFNNIYLQYKTADNIRIHGRYVFIFQGSILITVYQLEKRYYAMVDKIIEHRKSQPQPGVTADNHDQVSVQALQ
jgi:hypothetical protein